MAALELRSLADVEALGALLAGALPRFGNPALLLRGPLGCGKTTLAAAVCRALPGGSEAEISSPSFTLCSRYPCAPPVLHCDLYRCGANPPEEIYEFMDEGEGLLIVEWAERLPMPPSAWLDICFNVSDYARALKLGASAGAGQRALDFVISNWQAAR